MMHLVPALWLMIAGPARAAPPSTWAVADLRSTAEGERTVHAVLLHYDDGLEAFVLATLDPAGLWTPAIDWEATLGTVLDRSYLGVATSPAPAQDVTIDFADGTSLTVHLPDTSGLDRGAAFAIDTDTLETW